jgi:uncharacterized membrane protein
MTYLFIGLLVFLGLHSLRIVVPQWRAQRIQSMGEAAYKGIYSLASAAALGLVVWGFGVARESPVMLWLPPFGMRHAASLLMVAAFILIVAAYVPGNSIKSWVHHPMVLAVKVWAIAHLLANGSVAHVTLFGSFLVWAVIDFRSARQRDRLAGVVYPAGKAGRTALTVAIGLAVWAAFAFWAHGALIGVRPLG